MFEGQKKKRNGKKDRAHTTTSRVANEFITIGGDRRPVSLASPADRAAAASLSAIYTRVLHTRTHRGAKTEKADR